MSESQKENISANGNTDHDRNHDEYQYLDLIENIIKKGEFFAFCFHHNSQRKLREQV